jgi:hypothetical protein
MESNGPKWWFEVCVKAGMDAKVLSKMDLMELFMTAGKILQAERLKGKRNG